MTKNTTEALQKISLSNRMYELLRCARLSSASGIKIHSDGIDIIVDGLVTTPLIRAAVSLQECYPDGGVYVTSYMGTLVLCVYYNRES